jgi:hypothetical protein
VESTREGLGPRSFQRLISIFPQRNGENLFLTLTGQPPATYTTDRTQAAICAACKETDDGQELQA